MVIMKKVSTGLAAGLLAIGLMGGVASPSFAITSPSQVASVTNTQSNIVTEIQVIEGKEYKVQWNKKDDSIKIYESDGKLMGSTTMSKVKMLYQAQIGSPISLGNPKPGMVPYAPNACSITLTAAGVANSVLWTAAGLTAVAPPAAIAAAGGGLLTGTILAVGSMWC